MLNPNSPIPLYRQLSDILISKIRSGEYPPGSKIPSEHKLSATCGIGRPTVRQAIDLLVRKQFLNRKRGSGTFVNETQKEINLFSLAGTLSAFEQKDISLKTQLITPIKLQVEVEHTALQVHPEKTYFLSRLSFANDIPVLIEEIYFHPILFKGIESFDFTGRSISQIIEEHFYLKPSGGKQTFNITYLTGDKAQYLNISGTTPILFVKRFLHFMQTKNAIYSKLFCRTDQFDFSQTLGGNTNEQTGIL